MSCKSWARFVVVDCKWLAKQFFHRAVCDEGAHCIITRSVVLTGIKLLMVCFEDLLSNEWYRIYQALEMVAETAICKCFIGRRYLILAFSLSVRAAFLLLVSVMLLVMVTFLFVYHHHHHHYYY